MTDFLIGLGLEPVIIGPWISALGWSLVHFLWQGTLIGGLFAVGRWLLRDGRPQHRYWLGLASMAAMAAVPIATFIFLLESSAAASLGVSGSVSLWADPTIKAVVAGAGFTPVALALSLERVLPWVVGIWALGVLVMSTRVGIHWVRMLRLSTIGTLEINDDLLARVEHLKNAMGVTGAVRVVETTVAQVPTVLGWLKPVILLPTSTLMGLTPGQLDLVIAHELGHIRRLDYLINLAQIMVETLLFYHPMVRWISRCVRDERETCCDDLVVEACGNRVQYAKALANLETMRGSGLEPSLAATGGQLLQRIERIVCTHRRRETSSINSGVLLLIVGCLVLAAQLADPMGVFEERRSRLADSLAADLLAERSLGESAYVPLSDARVVPADNPKIEIGDFSASKIAADAPVVIQQTTQLATQITVDQKSNPINDPIDPVAVSSVSSANKGSAVATAAPIVSREKPLAESPQTLATTVQEDALPAIGVPRLILDNGVSAPVLAVEAQDNPLPLSPATATTLESQTPTSSQPSIIPAKPSGPVAIRQMSPNYPVRARISGQEGYVELAFSIDYYGRVSEVRVVDSWPRRVFDRSAKRAIKGWRFDPSTVTAGEQLTQRFDFTLSRSEKPAVVGDACMPLTGTRICRHDSPTSLLAEAANQN